MKFFSTQFSDKAYFHLDGPANKQNTWFCGTGLPENFHAKSSHGWKVTIWVAM
jgi:hypothetical protein